MHVAVADRTLVTFGHSEGRRPRAKEYGMRRATMIMGLAITIVAAAAVVLESPLVGGVEIPNYTVTRTDGAIELRSYPPLNVATTTVAGDRAAAVNQGFRILASYIFGSNEGAEKIAMTAPVMQSRRDATEDGFGSTDKQGE